MKSVDSIGIDLGTSNVIIFNDFEGVLYEAPSALAVDRAKEEIHAVGENAVAMIGREPVGIEVVRPMRSGALQDSELMGVLLGHYVSKSVRKRLFSRTKAVLSSAVRLNQLDKKQFSRNLLSAGLGRVEYIDRPIAAAIGAGADVADERANLVIDVGSASTHIAVISRNKIISETVSEVGGDTFTERVIESVRLASEVHLGWMSAEDIKFKSTLSAKKDSDDVFTAIGKNIVAGRPEKVEIRENDINSALMDVYGRLFRDIASVFDRLSREYNGDIHKNGIILTGGGANLSGLDRQIEASFNIACRKLESASYCVAKGCAQVAENRNKYAEILRN